MITEAQIPHILQGRLAGWGPLDGKAVVQIWRLGEFFCLWKLQAFSIKAFNWLDAAHPHYGEISALLKVYWFKR